MNLLVRRSLIDAPFAAASQLFAAYVEDRTVTLFGFVPIPGLGRELGATVRATLRRPGAGRCSVHWEPADPVVRAPTEFDGRLWLEPDQPDERRSWLVLDGEYTWSPSDPLLAIVVRRLTAAIARDLLSRVGDVMEAKYAGARRAEAVARPP